MSKADRDCLLRHLKAAERQTLEAIRLANALTGDQANMAHAKGSDAIRAIREAITELEAMTCRSK